MRIKALVALSIMRS